MKNSTLSRGGKRKFRTAYGRLVEREVGAAEIEINGQSTYSIIIFGEESGAEVLGVTTLEELGLQVDPVTGELKPLELLLLLQSFEPIKHPPLARTAQ